MTKKNKKELKNYNSNHYCLIKNFIKKTDLSQIDKTFRIYLKKFLNFEIKSKKFIFHNKNLHNFLIKKKQKNKFFFHWLYNSIQASSGFHSFLNSKKILNLVSKFLDCKNEEIITSSYQLRADFPNDKLHRLDWHFDAFYDTYKPKVSFESKSGLVFYLPLQNFNKKNGTVQILKDSYKLKIKNKPIKQKNKITTKFKIKNSEIKNHNNKNISGKFGDIFVQSYRMLHRSGLNKSKKIRFTLIARYMNITDTNFKGCRIGLQEISD